jgi:transcription antitermination factor NusG
MEIGSHDRYWFALQRVPGKKKPSEINWGMRKIEHFVPSERRLSQWSDRKKQIEVPLFAGYCFAKFSSSDRLPVLQSHGVVRVVGANGRPESIPEDEIDSLKILIMTSSRYVSCPYCGRYARGSDQWSIALERKDVRCERQ